MKQIVPFKSSFDKAKKFDVWSGLLTYISAALFLIVFVLELFSQNYTTILWIDRLNCIVIVSYIILEFITDCIHSSAETYRRADLVDNAFGCKLASNRSEDYYTNDELQKGLYKLGVNSFESCFFSYKIAAESQHCMWWKAVFFAMLFFFCAIFGYNKGVIFIIQLSLPLTVILQAIKQQKFVSHLKNIDGNYRSIFDTLRNKKNISKNDYAKLTKEILEYEGTISGANILLNEKKYEELNKALSDEWNRIKCEYEIVQ